MKALLIAGGLGSRLRPLTHTRPKHLLPIVNRAHIEHVLDHLQAHGIDEVVLLTSYLADRFSGVIERARERGLQMEVAHESEPLGTAGAIKNAASLIGEETFLALNGDVLSSADLTRVLRFHRDSHATGTIVLKAVEDPSAFGVVPTEADGRVIGFIEKPEPGTVDTNLINAGIYVLEPEVLDGIPRDQVVSIEREVFPRMATEGKLFATPTDAYWMDIGTPQKYLQANLDALVGRFQTGLVSDPGETVSVIADSARIEAGAQVSSACIGEGCVVSESAVVTGSVLLDGVVISSGARVTDSVLGQDVEVAPGASVSGVTMGDGEKIRS